MAPSSSRRGNATFCLGRRYGGARVQSVWAGAPAFSFVLNVAELKFSFPPGVSLSIIVTTELVNPSGTPFAALRRKKMVSSGSTGSRL